MKQTIEYLASQYADKQNLPTKRRYIDERNDPKVCFTLMSYEVRSYVEQAFEDGYKLLEKENKTLREALDKIATPSDLIVPVMIRKIAQEALNTGGK